MDTPVHADERVSEFSRGKPIEVALPAIERELATLWRQVADRICRDGKKHAVTRACLWNLVVRVPGEAALGRAKRYVDAISPSVPARVLVLDARASQSTEPMRATIEANWHEMGGGSTEIGSDEVTLHAAGEAVDDLAPVVRALLTPDVPTAAMWVGAVPDPSSALDRELRAAADRLVLDGDAAVRGELPVAGLASLAAFLDGRQGEVEATDVAWLRAAEVRALLASLFDPPTDVACLRAVDKVRIACRPDRLGTAALVAGWIASRLGLRPRDARAPSGSELRFAREGGRGVSISLRREPQAADPVGSVELFCEGGRFAVTLSSGAAMLETPRVAWKEPLAPRGGSDLWIDSLGAAGRDRLYVPALRLLAALRR